MVHNFIVVAVLSLLVGSCSEAEVTGSTNKCEAQLFSNYNAKVLQQCVQACIKELSLKVGDGGNRKGGISWGCLTPPLLHRRSDMPCPTITSSN